MQNIKPSSSDTTLLLRVLRIARPFKNLFWWSIALSILITPFSIAQPFIVQQIVDQHIVPGIKEGVLMLSLLYIVVLLINVVMKYFFIYITAKLGQNVIKDLRTKVYKHVITLKSRYFDTTPIGTSTTRTINDIEAINNVFAQGVITITADIITLLAVTGIMLYTSWRLTLIVFITMPFMILATYIFKEKVKISYQKVRTQIANMNAFLQERISGMKTVQIFNAEKKESLAFREINRKYTSANLDNVFYYAIFFPFVELVSSVALALMIWLGAEGYLEDKVSFGALVAFPLYLNLLFRPIRFLADKFNTMQMGLVAAERVFKLLDTKDFIEDKGELVVDRFHGKVVFKNVSFAYDDENYVLKNVSFQINPGEKLAIVGSTGSGKSTIINILSRFYDIQDGKIQIDDQDIHAYTLQSLRDRIGIVLQDVFLFHGTVYENITLMDSSISLDRVKEAAEIIGADVYIDNLPGGYDFLITERGSNLSVGQRQLISFVRALVFDPDILILDEATSSIDTETEMVIQHAIEKLIEKRTSIIIAHRLSTIRNVDQIIVLDKGEIVERGNHEALLENENGHYKDLYEMQFADEIA
ncbi:MAG: ABC transporter ATP-binding protein [Saprospiraceae bacterium]|nr:ABC transporter ATP-binding protein [Saprospiraceae bacterium]MBK6564829.1 ABC transporter ATP-binding protein [Saprospiraceae bacterium]MBK7523473.1 ABC transporter ATP-binding protein [Saprospiraceae bacterium]MBK8548804.1 ABC transporter ATP-binding protein [Saprospiraceae bacterium]